MGKSSNQGFWTVEQVSEYLNVKAKTIYDWVSIRYIPFYRLGKLLRFKKAEIDEWLDKHKSEGRTTRIPKKN